MHRLQSVDNACESMNHILKQRQQWRRHMLPDLVENLRSVIASQYTEADSVISGRGNVILRPSHQKYRLSVTDWKALSETQRQCVRQAVFLLSCKGIAGMQQATSTDVNLTNLHRRDGEKKLGSHCRPRADHTMTQNKTQKV